MKTCLYSLGRCLTFPPASVRFQGCRACARLCAHTDTRVHTCGLSLSSKLLFTHTDLVTSCGLGARSSPSTPEWSVVHPPPFSVVAPPPPASWEHRPVISALRPGFSRPPLRRKVYLGPSAALERFCTVEIIQSCPRPFPTFARSRSGKTSGVSSGLAETCPLPPAT